MEKVKTQIFVEYKRFDFRNWWYERNSVDVEILKEDWQYEASNYDNKKTQLMLCLSSETDKKDGSYWLPENLPPNTESIILVETQFREENLFENALFHLKNKPNILTVFAHSKFQNLYPVSDSIYMNKNINDSTRQCLYVTYALCVSLMLKGRFSSLKKPKT